MVDKKNKPRMDKIEKRQKTTVQNRIKKNTTQAKSARMYKSTVQEKNCYIGNLAMIMECTYYK